MIRFHSFTSTLVAAVGAAVVAQAAVVGTTAGFAVPQAGRRFEFPRDYGSHPEFRLEWWYVTGHLWDAASNRFGFQVTFFRSAAPPASEQDSRVAVDSPTSPAFGNGHYFLAHTAVVEARSGRFLNQERINREGWDAGSMTNTLHVWNGNWSIELTQAEPPRMRLHGTVRGDASLNIDLVAIKPLVVFGTNGVSRKAASPEVASHYLTFTRLGANGTLGLDGQDRPVRGQAWMDHEFGSSQLGTDQSGWDWAGIQLNDGREVMAYRMRHADGSTDDFSTLTWVDREGRTTLVPASAFRFDPLAHWRSQRSYADYPLGLKLQTRDPGTGSEVAWRLEPVARDQEVRGGIGDVPYWEGACRVVDPAGIEVGSAYVELTGYAGNLGGQLR